MNIRTMHGVYFVVSVLFSRTKTRGDHISAANGFDFFNAGKLRFEQQFIKITNNLVEKSQAFQSLFVDISLVVKFLIIGYRCEHYGDTVVPFVIEFLNDNVNEMLNYSQVF